ncbi:sucrase ferredoxin [Allokutzneria sp. A3M-2-11 16]|uniref:sucrase ferredoxin n=1 Tax=Allokutzneria sp. A3M-2-11 16 TaxID=2962043 RepID=UPI0020B74379|nr:sucrase ferredoxin [Allokutzneria sp. A3M-2-11 16]MCP3803647.1 sucrase ferredoxin [Allokutzneria sp. A3M-2-11 16]
MTNCAVLAAAEPLAGTAPVAATWLCLEQPGPWGNDALVDSHLDRRVGAELARRMKETGIRIVLIRRPGRHPDLHHPRPRRVYLASTRPGTSWLRRHTIEDPEELLDLDFTTPFGTLTTDPLLLVCTNGKRDRCCALLGRPIAAELAAEHGEAIWESTHTGGHRFAPAVVALPTGYVHGRLDGPQTRELLKATAAGEMMLQGCRGRATWSREGQAAELAVRGIIREVGADSLSVVSATSDLVSVRHVDGREWVVRLAATPLPAWPNSCGKAAVEGLSFSVSDVRLV